jgi:hypothetical protein
MNAREEVRDEPQHARGSHAKQPAHAEWMAALGNVGTQHAVRSGLVVAPGMLARAARGIQREAAEEEEIEEPAEGAEAPAPESAAPPDPIAAAGEVEEELPE